MPAHRNRELGRSVRAVAVVTANTCQFPTPAEGDWILFMKTDKKQAGEAEKPKEEKPAQK
jgi:hypothetical protein